MLFDELRVWMDPVARPGPEAMAVDEWLLETAGKPLLRVYRWLGDWGSVGYFGGIAAAREAIPGLEWVRRRTGGGTVDHRRDWTYTIVSPAAGIPKGAESYRIIHTALRDALAMEGVETRLSGGEAETGAAACFVNPVNHDLVNPAGRKIAGAGQKRTRSGFLHQGSLALRTDGETSARRAAAFAAALAGSWRPVDLDGPAVNAAQRYSDAKWTNKR